MKKRNQRRAAGALLLLALAGFVYWDNNALETERFELSSSRLPEAFDGFIVVQLSDLHGKEFGPENVLVLGSTNDSLLACLLGATSVNPLPPHYRCNNCHYPRVPRRYQ